MGQNPNRRYGNKPKSSWATSKEALPMVATTMLLDQPMGTEGMEATELDTAKGVVATVTELAEGVRLAGGTRGGARSARTCHRCVLDEEKNS